MGRAQSAMRQWAITAALHQTCSTSTSCHHLCQGINPQGAVVLLVAAGPSAPITWMATAPQQQPRAAREGPRPHSDAPRDAACCSNANSNSSGCPAASRWPRRRMILWWPTCMTPAPTCSTGSPPATASCCRTTKSCMASGLCCTPSGEVRLLHSWRPLALALPSCLTACKAPVSQQPLAAHKQHHLVRLRTYTQQLPCRASP